MRYALCVLTCNAAETAEDFIVAVKAQTIKDVSCLAIDSSSTDNTAVSFEVAGIRVHRIPRASFNHGATRQLAVELASDADILIFMTQDAILADPRSLQNLLAAFADPKVGAAYGRQLPARDASPVATHARLFNYPDASYVRGAEDIPRYGIKAAFLSNSFAAYRRIALTEVGGFPADAILSEDTMVAARMLGKGWRVAYCAEATCYHSHNYTLVKEFQRYFDIGVFHGREKWYLQELGRAEGEGSRFVLSELRYLWRHSPQVIPSALVRTMCKFIGYRLGRAELMLPLWLKRRVSMNKGYWGGY